MISATAADREKRAAQQDAEDLAVIDALRKRLEATGLSNLDSHLRVLEAYGATSPKASPATRLRAAEEALGLPSQEQTGSGTRDRSG